MSVIDCVQLFRIEKTFVGTCHPQYGYIILLLSKDDQEKYWQIGDGHIQDTSGDVIFKVSFRAIACMPERDEVLDGKVVEVSPSGIRVQSGPIATFISLKVRKVIPDLTIFTNSTKFVHNDYRKTRKNSPTIRQRTHGFRKTATIISTGSWKRVFTSATASPHSNTSTMTS